MNLFKIGVVPTGQILYFIGENSTNMQFLRDI